MGNAESTQSSDVGAIAGLTNSSAFHQQSPNVARLIQSDTSSKMEYEFPISDVPTTSSTHHHHTLTGPNNHSILPSNTSSRHGHSSSYHSNSSTSASQLNHSSHIIGNHEQKTRSKLSSNSTSNLCFSLISCFGCRTNDSANSSMNPLRDKVHGIRIVRASNDLTPAVFDSHYNIITLEQLRECDNNINANPNSASNDSSDPLPAQNTSNTNVNAQNGNGSVTGMSQTASSSTKKDTHTHRLKKKKKKRSASATYASRPTGSDDEDDDDDRMERT